MMGVMIMDGPCIILRQMYFENRPGGPLSLIMHNAQRIMSTAPYGERVDAIPCRILMDRSVNRMKIDPEVQWHGTSMMEAAICTLSLMSHL